MVNALLIVALVIITGAMHLDGLADTCDGIAGHKTVEERWKVMHDSRTGAFGVVGVVLLLLVKYVSLDNVPPDSMTPVCFLCRWSAAGRWSTPFSLSPTPAPRDWAKLTRKRPAGRSLPIATVFTLAIAAALYPLFHVTGFLMIGGVWLVTTALAFYLKYKFAGLTGDTYGAINEVAEVMTLLIFCHYRLD